MLREKVEKMKPLQFSKSCFVIDIYVQAMPEIKLVFENNGQKKGSLY